MEWPSLVGALVSLLAILDPIGAVPAYLSVCPAESAGRRRMVLTTTLTVVITLTIFFLVGQNILRLFSISLPAFRTAGGVLILSMSIEMLRGRISQVKQTPEEASELPDRNAVAIVPLAIPLLSGPGSITMVMIFSQHATDWSQRITFLGVIGVCALAVFVTLTIAGRLQRWLGQTGISVMNRVMGLILTAVGVQFIGDGLRALLPGLGG